jgi:hypothetical protein
MKPAFSPPAPQIFLRHRSPFEVLAIRYFVTTVPIRLCVNQPEISSFNALSEVDATNLPVDNVQCGSFVCIRERSDSGLVTGAEPTFRPERQQCGGERT